MKVKADQRGRLCRSGVNMPETLKELAASGWAIDEKTGLAVYGGAEVHKNGQGRLRLMDQGQILADAPPPVSADAAETEDGFIVRPFRMLSAILIDGYFLDLSDQAMLKKALPLFNNVTIFKNHDPDVDDWVGVALNARWSEELGVPGIDADFKIDKANNPRLARGLSMQPPAINACSVELRFQAKRSHADMGWEFYENLGREVDGQIVRWIVTRITRIPEVSLVYAGADPSAKALHLDRFQPGGASHASAERLLSAQTSSQTIQEEKMEEELKQVQQQLEALKKDQEVQSKELERLRAFEESETKAAREEALRLYQTASGEKANAALLEVMKAASLGQSRAFIAEYSRQLEEAHPVRCQKCGSQEISRASSQAAAVPGNPAANTAIDMKDFAIGNGKK